MQSEIIADWWKLPPYTIQNTYMEPSGVIGKALVNLIDKCYEQDATVKWNRVENIDYIKNMHADSWEHGSKETHFGLPISVHSDMNGWFGDNDVTFLPIVHSPGSVYFYSNKGNPIGSVLLAVIFEGWPLLLLILLAAAFAAIVIWILDRLWNPEEFPKPFIKGFWEGFWWAFVTMTTVGYGDSTPRSIQARTFGIAWIIVGVTILSVFTATVTAALTKENLEHKLNVYGKRVGVLNGTVDIEIAYAKGAQPVVMNNISNLLRSVNELDGAILDHYSTAYSVNDLDQATIIVGDILSPVQHGILVSEPNITKRQCLQQLTLTNQYSTFHSITQWIKPFKASKSITAAEKAQTLFQPATVMYIYYGIGAWFVVFCCFVAWECTYWRPKHKRRAEIKRLVKQREEKWDSLYQMSLQQKARLKRMRLKKMKKHSSTPPHLEYSLSNTSNISTSIQKSSKQQIKHDNSSIWCTSAIIGQDSFTYVNSGLDLNSGDDYEDVLSASASSKDLMKKQHDAELGQLHSEFIKYKQKWKRRAVLMQRRHHIEHTSSLHKVDIMDEDDD